MEEVRKSVNPIVYKSASVRNLPVPVQSVSQPAAVHIMDAGGDPFESAEEEAYNRAIEELAKVKLDCATQLGKLQQEVTRLASGLSGGSTGDGDSAASSDLINSTVDSGNETLVAGNKSSLTTVISGLFNATSSGGGPACPDPPQPKECTPCRECPTCLECPPVSNDDCVPSTTSRGDPDTPASILATPEAILVGAAATLFILLLAAAVGLVLRYVPILFSGLLVLVLVALVWYLSSKYPGAARRLGARIWAALRSGVSAAVERLLGRRNFEVSRKVC
jgi:hypothetical protein